MRKNLQQVELTHNSISSTELQLNIHSKIFNNCLLIMKITKIICYNNLSLYGILACIGSSMLHFNNIILCVTLCCIALVFDVVSSMLCLWETLCIILYKLGPHRQNPLYSIVFLVLGSTLFWSLEIQFDIYLNPSNITDIHIVLYNCKFSTHDCTITL